MNQKTKRILSGVGALIIALALAIGGTYAYQQFEHKSNPFRNDPDYLGRLVEDFEEKDWDIDTDIKKEISVKNMGGTEQFPGKKWGDIYVRVQLKEHMDLTPINYVYYDGNGTTATRFMVDKEGDFVRFTPTEATMSEVELDKIRNSTVWLKVIDEAADRTAFTAGLRTSDFVLAKGYYDSRDYWYLKTKEGDPNGQYGAFLVMSKEYDNSNRTNITPTVRAEGIDYSVGVVQPQNGHDNGECEYAIHYWDPAEPHLCPLDSHKYAKWNLGDKVIMLDEWMQDPKLDNVWILDPSTGWATWGNALKPGESTALLLESITPLLMPDGQLLYVIHADMQATDLSEMGDDWIIKPVTGGQKPENVAVESVVLNHNTATVVQNGSLKLNATVNPANATNKAVTWESSDPTVATVDRYGNVKALKVGSATITVTTVDGGKTDSCAITVTREVINPTGITVTPGNVSLTPNKTQQLNVAYSPTTTTERDITWTSSNTSVATVDSNGLVTAKAVGTATITATAVGGAKASSNVTVTREVINATSITLSPTSVTLDPGQTRNLTVTYTPSTTTERTITWSSSNSSVATVDASGKVTAVAQGSATITATAVGGAKATCAVTVNSGIAPDLPVKDDITMKSHPTDAKLNYSLVILAVGGNFEDAQVAQAGTIKLTDVFADSFTDYSRVTIKSTTPASALSKVTIGTDKDGDPALVITYPGPESIWGNAKEPEFQLPIVIGHPDYSDTAIEVTVTTLGSLYAK